MTDAEERLLADGRNFENNASIRPGALEILFRCTNLIDRAIDVENEAGKKDKYPFSSAQVSPGHFFYMLTQITQEGLRVLVARLSPSVNSEFQRKSNFNRYYRMWKAMKDNLLLNDLMTEEYQAKGGDSNWVLDKVFVMFE